MTEIKALVDRVADALGPDADPARIEAVVSSLLETGGSGSPLSGARLHVGLSDCSSLLTKTVRARAYDKIRRIGSHLEGAFHQAGLSGPVRISTTPLTQIAGRAAGTDFVVLARMLDDAARDCGASSISGLSADVADHIGASSEAFISVLPEMLSATSRVVMEVVAASERSGIHIDAVRKAVESLRQFSGEPKELHRVRITSAGAADPPDAAATFYLTADAGPMIYEARRSAPEAAVDDLCDILTATAFALGRRAASSGEQAADAMRGRSGLEVRFGGVDVISEASAPHDAPAQAAYCAAVAEGFRAAVYGSRLFPPPQTLVLPNSASSAATAARVVDILAAGAHAVHVLFRDTQSHVEDLQEPEWIIRGGHIPALGKRLL